ncbi:unnamed protein product [Prorocentrum cordatum]|uniref:ABC1 atypical kinase-like domain-containing protein n=1 Tax=Prorocentrum cordatum TaxID=2364126 RepID=A0ABN9TKL5_9DINO|nr:unnamed protein product [Polarella glacialis]
MPSYIDQPSANAANSNNETDWQDIADVFTDFYERAYRHRAAMTGNDDEQASGRARGQGLIHGDPHPGNIFVERKRDDPSQLRPVLLDWGLVRQLNDEERLAMAQWAVATMSRDRIMYMSALQKLGFSFKEDFEEMELEDWLIASAYALRDSIPSASQWELMDQLSRQREDIEDLIREERGADGLKQAERQRPTGSQVENVPGTVLFFLRGLELLQSVCGALDVSVRVAELILGQAMPVLEASASAALLSRAPAAAAGGSRLELAARGKLEELSKTGAVLGAQVCVLDSEGTAAGDWSCNIAFGRIAHAGAQVTEGTLMPLLDVGVGVLVLCFLRALSAKGPQRQLDARVSELWPEFAREGKGRVSRGGRSCTTPRGCRGRSRGR